MKKDKLFAVSSRLLEYSLYGLLFFIPISKAWSETFAGFMLLFFILKKIARPDFSFLKTRANVFLLFFVLFCLLSMFNSGPFLLKSLRIFFLKWMKYIGIYLFAQDALRDHKRIKRCVGILCAAAVLIGIDACFQRLSGMDFLRERKLMSLVNGVPAITGPFNHYNDFASYLVVILSLLAALLISGMKNKALWLFLVAQSMLLTACLFMTFSRGAWLGFFIAMLLMFYLSGKFRKAVPWIAGAFLLAYFLPGVKERVLFSFQEQGDADRLIVWGAALRMISEHPFLGKGLGTFMDHFGNYTRNLYIQYAHNCYLQIWAETGIFSLAGFLMFAGISLLRGVKAFFQRRDFMLLGIVCGLCGFLAHSFFDTQLYSLQMSFLFWVTMGLLAALTRSGPAVSK